MNDANSGVSVLPDGSVKDVPPSELAVDGKVLIKPGEEIPADGVIVAGANSVDEAMITAETLAHLHYCRCR